MKRQLGSVVAAGGGAVLIGSGGEAEPAYARPMSEWSTDTKVTSGQNYSAPLNDGPVTEWTDTKSRTRSGFIGLQNYQDGKTVRHRNLRVKERL